MGKKKKLKGVPMAKPVKRHEFTLSLVIREGDNVITKAIRGYVDENQKYPAADTIQFGTAVAQIIAAASPALIPRSLVNGSVSQAVAEVATNYLKEMEA